MGELVPIDDSLNYRRVMQRIKTMWEEGIVVVWPHAREEMANDHLDDTDLAQMIRTGSIRPRSHSLHGNLWRYVVEGSTVDHGKAACVVQLDSKMGVVTVYSLSKGRTRD